MPDSPAPSGSERPELERVVPRGDVGQGNGQAPKNQQSVGTEVQAVMAELVALRTILLNVLYKQVNGESLTAEEMQRLIERTDADKLKKAAERLQQGSKSSST
jgi:hypothetical protein